MVVVTAKPVGGGVKKCPSGQHLEKGVCVPNKRKPSPEDIAELKKKPEVAAFSKDVRERQEAQKRLRGVGTSGG